MPAKHSGYLRTSMPDVPLIRPGTWREHAACRNHPHLPPEVWDDSLAGSECAVDRGNRIRAAQWVCKHRCQVRQECLADVDLHYDDGVRGGVDLRDLRREGREFRRLLELGVDERAARVLAQRQPQRPGTRRSA